MKIKLIALLALFLANSCPNKSNNDSVDQIPGEYEIMYKYRKAIDNELFPNPDDYGEQNYSKYEGDKNTNGGLFKVKGRLDFNNKTIIANIPVGGEKMKIKKYVNLSTDTINAILVVLKGNNGKSTRNLPITKNLDWKIKISSTGLNEEKLRKHGKLMIYVLHDDDFHSGHVLTLMKCVNDLTSYNDDSCFEIVFPEPVDLKRIPFRPNDMGGDIIP